MRKTPEQASKVVRCASTNKKKSTYSQAKKEARFMRYDKKYPKLMPIPYFHKECGWWHVGNSDR